MSEYFIVHSVAKQGSVIVMDGETDSPLHYFDYNHDRSEAFNHRNAVWRSLGLRAGGDGSWTPHHVLGSAPVPHGLQGRGVEGWLTVVAAGED